MTTDTTNREPNDSEATAIKDDAERVAVGNDNENLPQYSAEDQKFYKQSIYIAAIDRYFGLNGLRCYVANAKDGLFSFGFEHIATGERILVFPHMEEWIVDIDCEMEQKHRIIIDCEHLDMDFTECSSCKSDGYTEKVFHDEGYDLEAFYLLINGVLYETPKRVSSCMLCGNCWGRIRPLVLEETLTAMTKVEYNALTTTAQKHSLPK